MSCTIGCLINMQVGGDHAYCSCSCHAGTLPAIPPSRERRAFRANKSEVTDTALNAIYLLGFNAGMAHLYIAGGDAFVEYIEKLQTPEYKKAIITAAQIISGGAFNPLDVSRMDAFVERIKAHEHAQKL